MIIIVIRILLLLWVPRISIKERKIATRNKSERNWNYNEQNKQPTGVKDKNTEKERRMKQIKTKVVACARPTFSVAHRTAWYVLLKRRNKHAYTP